MACSVGKQVETGIVMQRVITRMLLYNNTLARSKAGSVQFCRMKNYRTAVFI